MSASSTPATAKPTKRALILAGGGMKVAFQAGVLQVLLDEAKLDFDHADGCSGGVFNLAMWCQGKTGKQIADNWRDFPVKDGIDPHWKAMLKAPVAESLMTMDKFRENILRKRWALDWDRIHQGRNGNGHTAAFNAYNFSEQQLDVREASEVDEDFLVACVSLPMWFPPVEIDGETYIDSVFITDANLEDAIIEHGADELWVIWTVSSRNEWHNGFVGNYFGIIETAANGHFARIRDRIARNNDAIDAGGQGEFGRRIELKVIRGEVPLHYLVNLNPDRFTQAVELGVAAARQWCLKQQPPIPLEPQAPAPGTVTSLSFKERMDGFMTSGTTDYEQGYSDGKLGDRSVALKLKIQVDDVDGFISDPDHDALVTGELELGELGGTVPVRDGRFNLMPFKDDIDERWMFYWLPFQTADGKKFVLSGHKQLRNEPGRDLWKDSTTLWLHLLEGAPDDPPPVADLIDLFRHGGNEGTVVAAGKAHIGRSAFAKQLTTFRADGPTRRAELIAKMRFGAFFVGGLWDVYRSDLLPSSPF